VAYPIRLSGRGWCASSVGGGVSAVLGGVSVLATFIYIYTLNFGDDRLENNVTNLNAAFGKVRSIMSISLFSFEIMSLYHRSPSRNI